jgi:hypothetical protein
LLFPKQCLFRAAPKQQKARGSGDKSTQVMEKQKRDFSPNENGQNAFYELDNDLKNTIILLGMTEKCLF